MFMVARSDGRTSAKLDLLNAKDSCKLLFFLRDGRSFKHRVQGTKLRFCLFLISPSMIGRLTAEYKVDMRAYQSYKLAYYLFIFLVYHRSRSTAILLCY